MKYLILGLLCFFSFQAQSQQYSFINYSVEKGLASSQVIDICQDNLGYIWVGTQSGLSRFDGVSFKNYSVNEGLTDNKIEKLYLDSKGKIWVATQKGISSFSRSGDQFKSYYFKDDQTELETRVNSLLEYQSKIHVASDSGMYLLEKEKIVKLDAADGEQPKIREFVNLGDTALYCGTNDGVKVWTKDSFRRFQNSALDSTNIIGITYFTNTLAVATISEGLVTYDFEKGSSSVYEDPTRRFRSVYADSSIILGVTRGRGVLEITDEGSFLYNGESGMITEAVRAVFVDSERNIWIGTDGNGLFKFSGKSVRSYHVADGLNSELVLSITQGRDCTYVFGTYDAGVAIKRPDDGFTYLSYAQGVQHSRVWAVEAGANNRFYLATQSGVDYLDLSARDTLVTASNVNSKSRTIHFGGNNLLAGGTDGLYKIVSDSAFVLPETGTMDINKVVSNDRYLYVGANSGLYQAKLGGASLRFEQIMLDENNVQSLCADRNGNLWIGTINGLYLKSGKDGIIPLNLDNNEFFRSRNVVGLIEDRAGNIWISTYNGVYMLTWTDPDSYDYEIRHYTLSEGMVDLECNQNAIYEDHLGHIWIGTAAGLARIDPSLNNILFDFKLPNLHFTGVRLFSEKIDYQNYESVIDSITGVPTEITLPFNENHITFDFIGINMKDPEAVNYSYRLAQSETDEWSPISTTNYATYSAIQPGEYNFEVKAANKNMEWTEIQSIRVIVLPPFWRTWWFILLILAAIAGLIAFIFQARIRAIKQKQENEKLSFKNRLLFLEQRSLNASMNRHFIFNSLNSIQYFINSQDKKSANKYLSNFAKLIRKNLDSSTSNNFIVTLQEEIERIELYLALEKMRFHDKFEYEMEISSELDTEEIEIPSMILQPFVENSIIHGVLPKEQGGLIEVNIFKEYDDVVFEVIDNGIGIDNSLINKDINISGDHESKGMEITNRRIELLRKLTGENLLIIGPFQLNNEDGTCRGTKVIIKMGLGQDQAEVEHV